MFLYTKFMFASKNCIIRFAVFSTVTASAGRGHECFMMEIVLSVSFIKQSHRADCFLVFALKSLKLDYANSHPLSFWNRWTESNRSPL